MHRLQGLLETALDQKMALPERKITSIEAFLERFPAVKTVIFDGTERPVQRPQDHDQQKDHDSGQKKRHTRQHSTGTTRDKRVIILTPAKPGTIHDSRQLREEILVDNIPDEVAIEGALGFQGLQHDFVHVYLPHKKPRGKALSEIQKEEHKAFSAQRVVCEHAHAGIKRYNSVTSIYRHRVTAFDDRLMLTATGLGNFYLEAA